MTENAHMSTLETRQTKAEIPLYVFDIFQERDFSPFGSHAICVLFPLSQGPTLTATWLECMGPGQLPGEILSIVA